RQKSGDQEQRAEDRRGPPRLAQLPLPLALLLRLDPQLFLVAAIQERHRAIERVVVTTAPGLRRTVVAPPAQAELEFGVAPQPRGPFRKPGRGLGQPHVEARGSPILLGPLDQAG